MSRRPWQKLAGGLWVASSFRPQPAGEPSPGRMKSSCVLLTALVALAAYYIYIPLPSSVSDPWKLMLLDATFRTAQQVHYLKE
nr:PREDICTED: neutral cholesterol ester hydrolase 1-like [Equus przewalskii]